MPEGVELRGALERLVMILQELQAAGQATAGEVSAIQRHSASLADRDDRDGPELLEATRHLLSHLWFRAIKNQITQSGVQALRYACVAIAIADRGVDRCKPHQEWMST